MSLVLAANDIAADLTAKIRSRIGEGAPVWEPAAADVPAWFVAELEGAPAQAVFQSVHALVAVMEQGQTIVRRAR